jgi:arsenate reductase (thioredoxin)
MPDHKPVVLILCTGNSCRSQMAEGFLRKYAGDRYDARSAGMEPKPEVHPLAARVMAETGIDISHHHPKSVSEFLGKVPVLHLLIVCNNANNTCPRIWPGAHTRAYMPFDDPAEFRGSPEQMLNEFRRVRDLIGEAMRTWQPRLGGTLKQHQE